MDSTAHLQSLLVGIAREHRKLQHRLQELRQLVRRSEAELKVSDALVKVATVLAELREQMQAHFAEEASGGLMEEAVVRLPRLAEQAATIEHEHPALIARISEAIELTKSVQAGKADWPQVQSAVEGFVRQMLLHEATENHLLQQGFNQDLELLD